MIIFWAYLKVLLVTLLEYLKAGFCGLMAGVFIAVVINYSVALPKIAVPPEMLASISAWLIAGGMLAGILVCFIRQVCRPKNNMLYFKLRRP